MKKNCLTLFCFISCLQFFIAQTNFFKYYPSETNLYLPQVERTADNGYIVCANTGYNTKIVKHDQCGNIVWSKSVGFPVGEFNIGPSGNIVLSSGMYSSPSLVKLDAYGNLISGFVYNSGAYRYFVYSSGEFANGDMFISGIAELQTNGPYCYFVIKTNASGMIKWSIQFDQPCCWGFGIACSDGGVIVRSGSICYKTDSLGNMQWSKIIGNTSYSFKPIEVNNGFVFARYSESSQRDTCFLYKVDMLGNLTWASESFYANDLSKIVRIPSGNFITVGNLNIDPVNYRFLPTIIELDSTGHFIGQNVYRPPVNVNSFRTYSFCRLDDGCLIFTGREVYSTSNSSVSDLYVAKAGKKKKMGCGDSLITAHYAPKQIAITNYPVTVSNLAFTTNTVGVLTVACAFNDETACSGYDSIKFNFQNLPCLPPEGSLTLTGPPGREYLWSNGSTTQNLIVTVPGVYNLSLIEPCSGDAIVASATVNYCEYVSLEEHELQNQFKIYPNPTNGKMSISSSGNSIITVTSLLSEVIIETTVDKPSAEIDLSNQPKGIYFVSVQNAVGKRTFKILLE